MGHSGGYDEIVRKLCGDRDVSVMTSGGMKRFGASGELRVNGRMFAFSTRGRLIVKLPRERVAALIADGVGRPCTMGNRTMREWVVIGPERHAEWPSLAAESKNFVKSL